MYISAQIVYCTMLQVFIFFKKNFVKFYNYPFQASKMVYLQPDRLLCTAINMTTKSITNIKLNREMTLYAALILQDEQKNLPSYNLLIQ